MKILITGGTGFQGSHLAKSLLAKGHEITLLNTYSSRAETNIAEFRDKVNLVWGSVTDKEIVEKSVRNQDAVFHLAGRINVDESIASPFDFVNSVIVGTFNVLEAVKKFNNRLIFTSSCEVYGSADQPIGETKELKPQSPYAASKASADRLCYAYWKTYGIKVTIVRPFNVFGERQKEGINGAVIPIFIHQAMKKEPLIINGSGIQARDYTYIDDLIRGYNLILEHPELNGEIINFGTGQKINIIKIAEYIAKKFNVEIQHRAPRPGEVEQFICDFSKAKKILSWEPKYDVWQGIDKYISWREKLPL